MDCRVFGPLEVWENGQRLPLGGPKQRTVLVHLLLRPGRLVAAERLIDELWGEAPPAAARNVVQTYVSHLRKALGRERLEGRSGGYVLHVDPSEVDAWRFESLVDQARQMAAADPGGAVAIYEDALVLCRGPALDDLADQPSLLPEIVRLEELRMAATEERIAAELALGRHQELVPELETLVARHPLRERLWAHLIVALYRSGRQADALAAFRRVRETLVEQLGIDPSPDLERVYEQVLRQDPALEVAGEPLRGYRLLELIGEGAFAAVHRAIQPQIGREVAVKVIRPALADDPNFIRRFEVEAQLIARLEHPHVVPLYDYWREPGAAYLVMRFLRGGSLRDALDRGALGIKKAAAVAEQIALALASAHRQGVVHRDVKPENILLDEDGNAYLSDFGIAKDTAAQRALTEDEPNTFPCYLSPEEIRGAVPTPPSDIYSLGLVTYEILAGRHPYAGSPPEAVLDKHLSESLPSLHSASVNLPTEVDAVIARATAKNPGERYGNAPEFASALRAALGSGPGASLPVFPARNPYKGLRPFVEAEAADFSGRERLVERLVGRMSEETEGYRLLAVVGPSGSGKSSLVRAGLIPALRRGAVPGSDGWFIGEMTPGEDPFAELETALLRVAHTAPGNLRDEIERDDSGLLRATASVLPDNDSDLLLVIDQFEELFTRVENEGRRTRFLRNVVTAATDSASRVRLVITLRADFYDRPLLHGGLAAILRSRTEVVIPLTAEEIERAVASPARLVGVAVEPGLVARLAADVTDQPGALPLLQYALTELFDRRKDSTLTSDVYRELGGISGALTRRAEEVFASFSPPEQEAARQLFLRLVNLGEGTELARRTVPRTELLSLGASSEEMETIIETLGTARLVSFDRDPRTRDPTVEVAHEALLREWARLRAWIKDAREDVQMERWLARTTREWFEAGRNPSFLVGGSRLEQLEEWRDLSGLALTPDESEFLDASLAERSRRLQEEEERQESERALERRSGRRLRALVAVLATAAVAASGLTMFALTQQRLAEREGRIAAARELAAAAVASLEEDAELSVLLAIEAVDRTRSVNGTVLPEAQEALHRAVTASRILLRVPDVGGGLDWSPDGTMFVTEGPEESGVIDIRDARTGTSLRSFHGHDADVNLVTFSPDGTLLATSGDDGALRVWDPSTGDAVREFLGPSGAVWGPSFSPDGSLVAASWASDGMVRVFDLATGSTVSESGPWEPSLGVSFSPDGRQMGIATINSGGVVVDVGSGDVVRTLGGHEFGVSHVIWSPDGRWIATSGWDSKVVIWEAAEGTARFSLFGHTGEVVAIDWSSDSTRLVSGAGDGTARVWEISENGPRELLTLSGRERGGGVWVAFSPDGERIMTGDQAITAVKVWDVSLNGGAEWANLPADPSDFGDLAFTPDGRGVAVSNGDGTITVWDPEGREEPRTVGEQRSEEATPVLSMEVSGDGEMIAAAGTPARVWDLAAGAEAFTVPGDIWDVAWSPDGSLLAAAAPHEGVARIVDRDGREVGVLRAVPGSTVEMVRFSPDGNLVATSWIPAEPDPIMPQVQLWDWMRGEVVRSIEGAARAVAFDPTGERIATAPLFGPPAIWEVDSGRTVITLDGHTGGVMDLAFSPDGSRIATASTDGTIRLWDAGSGAQELVLRGHGDTVWAVAFSPDGSKLASAGRGSVRIWALEIDDLLSLARRRLTRPFTEGECRQYLHVEACPAERNQRD